MKYFPFKGGATKDPYHAPLVAVQVQGDQLYMAVCFWYRVKSDYPFYACSLAYFFTRYQNNTDMFIWSSYIFRTIYNIFFLSFINSSLGKFVLFETDLDF